MAGALFGYAIETDLPLARLRSAVAGRGTLRLAPGDIGLLDLPGELVGWYETAEPPWRIALARTRTGVLADCSNTGTFLVEPGEQRVRAVPRDDTGPRWQHVMVATAIPLLLSELGDLVLHASAVVADGRAVAFCAPAGRGKSTLAYRLATAARPLLAEDGLVLTPHEDGWLAWPGPKGVRLLNGDQPGKRTHVVDPAAEMEEPAPLAAAVVLDERGDGPLEVERLEPVEGVQALMANATFVPGDGTRRAFSAIARVAERIPVHRARLPDDLEAIVPAGEELLARVAADSPG
jgi:hypothetical protein